MVDKDIIAIIDIITNEFDITTGLERAITNLVYEAERQRAIIIIEASCVKELCDADIVNKRGYMTDTIYLYDDNIGRVQLIQHWGDDKMVVNAARVSFGQDNEEGLVEKDKKLINYLVKHRHTSTLEHCGLTFKFVVPMFVARQHMRHRTWSYNEISRRYTSVDIKFYEPVRFRKQSGSNRQASTDEYINPVFPAWRGATNVHYIASKKVKSFHKESLNLYNTLIEHGVCREQARGVLPQSMYCEYYGTTNLNNLFKFVGLRTHDGAQWEIQKVAEACLEMTREFFPESVKAFEANK